MKSVSMISAALLLAGCSATTKVVGTTVLPTSGRSIDIVQHRTDSEECGVGVVLQTYDQDGKLIDSHMAEGNAFHCQVVGAAIQAGGMVGAASVLRPSRTNINNSNEQDQVQGQAQAQEAVSSSTSKATGISKTKNVKNIKTIKVAPKKSKGNNGYGNGGSDGSPNGKSDKNR